MGDAKGGNGNSSYPKTISTVTKEMEDWGDDLIHARAQADLIEKKTGKPANETMKEWGWPTMDDD